MHIQQTGVNQVNGFKGSFTIRKSPYFFPSNFWVTRAGDNYESIYLSRCGGDTTQRVVVGTEYGFAYRVQENRILIGAVCGQPRFCTEERELHHIWGHFAGFDKLAQELSFFFPPCILDTRVVLSLNLGEHLPVSLANFRVAR